MFELKGLESSLLMCVFQCVELLNASVCVCVCVCVCVSPSPHPVERELL